MKPMKEIFVINFLLVAAQVAYGQENSDVNKISDTGDNVEPPHSDTSASVEDGKYNRPTSQELNQAAFDKVNVLLKDNNVAELYTYLASFIDEITQSETASQIIIKILDTFKNTIMNPNTSQSIHLIQVKIKHYLMRRNSPERVKRHVEAIVRTVTDPKLAQISNERTKQRLEVINNPKTLQNMEAAKRFTLDYVNDPNAVEGIQNIFKGIRKTFALSAPSSISGAAQSAFDYIKSRTG